MKEKWVFRAEALQSTGLTTCEEERAFQRLVMNLSGMDTDNLRKDWEDACFIKVGKIERMKIEGSAASWIRKKKENGDKGDDLKPGLPYGRTLRHGKKIESIYRLKDGNCYSVPIEFCNPHIEFMPKEIKDAYIAIESDSENIKPIGQQELRVSKYGKEEFCFYVEGIRLIPKIVSFRIKPKEEPQNMPSTTFKAELSMKHITSLLYLLIIAVSIFVILIPDIWPLETLGVIILCRVLGSMLLVVSTMLFTGTTVSA